MPKPDGADTGAAGRHLVCAQLLLRGWKVDLEARRGGRIRAVHAATGREITVRVNSVWHEPKGVWPLADRPAFEDVCDPDEYHVLVRFRDREAPLYYVLPRSELVAAVTAQFDEWAGAPKRSGEPRRSQLVTTTGLDERPYLDHWDLLTP